MMTCQARPRVRTLSRRRRSLALALSLSLAPGAAPPMLAYQTYGIGPSGQLATVKWKRLPVRYFVADRAAGAISSRDLQQAVARAFATWREVPSAAASAEFVGFTAADPLDDDGMSTLGFLSRPDLERVLGATSYLLDTVSGEIVESDIFFNASFSWSVAPSGETNRYDLESVALHEIGHLFGLGHSAIGETELRAGGGRRVIGAETAMFPIAFSPGNVAGRTLRADDVAGLSELYPDGSHTRDTGGINGRVTKNGRGVFGAHVVAFNPRTGKLVGNFSVGANGGFSMTGLDPGAYILRVEPLDDADLDSFFDEPELVDVDFAVTYLDRYVVVPRGGGAAPVEIKVAAAARAAAEQVGFSLTSHSAAAGSRRRVDAALSREPQAPAGPAAAPRPQARRKKDPGRPNSFSLTAGLAYFGSASLGSSEATLTPNQVGTTSPVTLFRASESLEAVPGADVRIGYHLTRRFAVEGGVTWSRPGIGLSVSGDYEKAPGFSVVGERMNQFFVDAAGVVAIKPDGFGRGRYLPFVQGGAGYLRQLHEGNTLVETGSLVHLGGGLKIRLVSRPTSFVSGLGLRVAAGAYRLTGGYSLDGRARILPALSAGVILSF